MDRKIKGIPSTLTQLPVAADFADGPPFTWLLQQAEAYGLRYLLAHADDGVIWGRVVDNDLHLSSGIASNSPALRALTLQSCRLFGLDAELFIWRSNADWQARLIEDEKGTPVNAFDEAQILWGTDRVRTESGFTLVRDGQRGHHHALPLEIEAARFDGEWRPAHLKVRHYLTIDEPTGLNRIARSRLVDITVKERVQ